MINARSFADETLNLSPSVFYDNPVTKTELLALAIVAQKINGEYVKRGGHSDFIEDEDGNSQYVLIKQSNRFVMETVQQLDSDALSADVMSEATEMMKNLELDYMFKVLGDELNDFETSIQQFLSDDEELSPRHHIGVVAYIPAYVEREETQKRLAERSIGSEHIGSKGDTVSTEIEIISKRPATAWAGYNINAITNEGNRISFFTTKEYIANKKGTFKITGKVKDIGRVWNNESIKETRLNYVKIL